MDTQSDIQFAIPRLFKPSMVDWKALLVLGMAALLFIPFIVRLMAIFYRVFWINERKYDNLKRKYTHVVSTCPSNKEAPKLVYMLDNEPRSFWGHHLYLFPLASIQSYQRTVQAWARKYGDVFMYRFLLNDTRFAVASMSGIQHVMLNNEQNYVKPAVMKDALSEIVGSTSVLIAEHRDHRRIRGLLHHAFRPTVLVANVAGILERLAKMEVEAWLKMYTNGRKTSNNFVELEQIHPRMAKLALSAICDYVYGEKVVSDKLYQSFVEVFLKENPKLEFFGRLMPFLRHIHPKLRRRNKSLKIMRDETIAVIRERRRQNVHGSETHTDLLSALIHARDLTESGEKMHLSEEELVDQVKTMFTAGQITTGVILSWALFCLGTNLASQQILYEELNVFFAKWDSGGSDTDAAKRLVQLDSLPVLDAVMKESIRLYTPITFTNREAIEADVIDGYWVPPGQHVALQLVALFRNPKVWGADYDAFRPDRWIHSDNQRQQLEILAMLPFAIGTRGCLGRNFALYEAKTVLSWLVRNFEIRVAPACEPLKVSFLSAPADLNIMICPRFTRLE
mmetsp:Transcript_10527/g.18081  ORF Transcript_10527/g.18081 Transcript_10527/m.18081 type:complete len:565 (-) Transcript_10527:1279-2973(-)